MPDPALALIYARSENHCIGKDGRIPWRLPDEFAHFKRTTMGCPIIMGRKTYEDHASALPGRLNLVISSNPGYQAAPGVEVLGSLEAAIQRAGEQHDRCFVIGGVGLFTQAFKQTQTIYETVVHAVIDGDTYLPEFDFTGWRCEVLENHPADERHAYAYLARRWDRDE